MVRGEQPWRLTLSVAAQPSSPTAQDGLVEDQGEGQPVVADLSGVRVDGLEPLVRSFEVEASSASGPADPLKTLFATSDAPLREGESCDLVFWGPPPSGVVEVHLPGAGEGSVGTVVELSPLARARVSTAPVDVTGVPGSSRAAPTAVPSSVTV